jgi:hypothetical protein
MPVVIRRLLQWTLLCSVCAVPSFICAYHDFDTTGMVAGVSVFIGAYTFVTSTDWFARFVKHPFVRRTLFIGYGARLMSSICYPVGMFADLIPGIISVRLVEDLARLVGFNWPSSGRSLSNAVTGSFVGTFAITLIQGTFVNILLGMFMLSVYGVQRAFCRLPEPEVDRCKKCGYDIRASYEFGRCPECGTPCSRLAPVVRGSTTPAP